MNLAPGSTLAHYRLIEKIGEGGMGVVWRAVDTTLEREVAIKVLPEALAGDPERLARFEREAKLLASLSHPNIATVHGLHDVAGVRFLAMELVRGEDLAQRLGRGPLPLEEALAVGRQVAEALEAAHEHGIIHRDLKPANVVLAPDGTVKVLDFGLAKAFDASAASGDASLSPTLTHPATAAGMILGTAAYMSPEQARGRAVDRRADVWAFGCLLHECLGGRRVFTGETVSDVLAAVLRAEVDWNVLPPSTPAEVVVLLRRCLDRDPRRRLRDIGEARVLLESPLAPATARSTTAGRRRVVPRAALALLLATAAAALAWILKPVPAPPLRKFVLESTGDLDARGAVRPALSPDGRRVALARDDGIYLRDLDRLEARRLDGTERPQMLTWSPDGEWLAFASGTRLMRVPVSGGAPQAIAELPGRPGAASGAAWLPDGQILLTTGGSGLLSVPSQGGKPASVLDAAEGENDFHHVVTLPEGRGVLFVVHGQGTADTLAIFDGGRRIDVLRLDGQWLDSPAYSPSGHLLFGRGGTTAEALWAVPFSLADRKTTGEPFLVASDAGGPRAGADGALVYTHRGSGGLRQLVWLNRAGEPLETLGEARSGLGQPALSPDGSRVAAIMEEQGDRDLWIRDLAAGTWNRLTFTPTPEGSPRWTAGGDRLVFTCVAKEVTSVCTHAADGSGDTEVLVPLADQTLDTSPDGRFLIYDIPGRGTRIDLWVREGDGEPRPLLATTDYESSPRISPDGRLFAHVAWELGEEEVYVREFPSGAGKWQISSRGGELPAWGGNELFYRSGAELIARTITSAGGVRIGPEERLFSLPSLDQGFDVSRDGRRILVVRPDGEQKPDELVVVQNWFAEFAGR